MGEALGWWSDLCELYHRRERQQGLCSEFQKIMGKGDCTSFWSEKWMEGESLKIKFGWLFNLITQKQVRVCEMGAWDGGRWLCDLKWRRDLRIREINMTKELMAFLNRATLKKNQSFIWRWKHSGNGIYHVKKAYSRLMDDRSSQLQDDQTNRRVFKNLWNNYASGRVPTIVWRILHK